MVFFFLQVPTIQKQALQAILHEITGQRKREADGTRSADQ